MEASKKIEGIVTQEIRHTIGPSVRGGADKATMPKVTTFTSTLIHVLRTLSNEHSLTHHRTTHIRDISPNDAIFALFEFMSSFTVITNLPRSSHCIWLNGIFSLPLYLRRWPSTILKSQFMRLSLRLLLKEKQIAIAAARMRYQMVFPLLASRPIC